MNHPRADPGAQVDFQVKVADYKEASGRTLIYIDESGFAHDMPRRYGYAEKGQRCHGRHDWHAMGRVNVIGALQGSTLLTACLFNGNIDSNVFHAWLTQDLLPKIPDRAVIVMDNAAFHKRQDIQSAIHNAGHLLEYLPPYSPHLNPIEHKWAQAKSLQRKLRCSVDLLLSSLSI